VTPGPSMDAAGLAAFYRRSGVRVARSESAWWYEAAPRFLLAIPSHRPLHLPDAEARDLIRREKLAGLRYICADEDGGRPSFQLVCDTPGYALEKLSANARSKIRRGLGRNEIRRVTGKELAAVAERAFVETMERQNRASAAAVETWRRMLAAADDEPAVEIWTAWHEGQFACYLVCVRIDDVCEFFQARSSNPMLKHYPNNALIYTLTEEMLVRRGLREVTFGIESPEPVEELDQFKLQMGFRKKPVRQRVIFHGALKAAFSIGPLRRMLISMGSKPEADVRLRKAAGILKFADGRYDPSADAPADDAAIEDDEPGTPAIPQATSKPPRGDDPA
jgi:hypothetical protein